MAIRISICARPEPMHVCGLELNDTIGWRVLVISKRKASFQTRSSKFAVPKHTRMFARLDVCYPLSGHLNNPNAVRQGNEREVTAKPAANNHQIAIVEARRPHLEKDFTFSLLQVR
jgi:hypothetical protein